MNLRHQSNKVIITGQSGTGKSTYFTRYVLNSFGPIYKRIFVFDHQGEFSERTGKPAAFNEEQLVESFETGMVVFDPSELFPGETQEAWDFFCEWTFERCKNNMGGAKLIAVDEMQMFSSTSQVSLELSTVIETGRKFELDFCAITQQLNLVHNRVRNQATEVVTFRHVDRLILDALELLGFDPEEVSSLPNLTYLCRDMLQSTQKRGALNFSCNSMPTRQVEEEQEQSSSDESESSPNEEP